MTPADQRVSIDDAMRAGFAHHAAGRLDQAEAIYRQVLAAAPAHAGALHLTGLLAHQRGDNVRAADLVARAVAAAPQVAEFQANFGVILHALGRTADAAAAFERAVQLDPIRADSLNNLGSTRLAAGRVDDAIELFRRAVGSKPDFRMAWLNLAMTLHRAGRLDEAAAAYEAALALPPIEPAHHVELGNILRDLGRHAESIDHLRRAVDLKPDFAEAWSNLGNALGDVGQIEPAIDCYWRALALRPELAEVHANLASRQIACGDVEEAIESARTAMRLKPSLTEAHQTYLMALSYRVHDAGEVLAAHRAWAADAERVAQLPQRAGGASDARTIRIGLVSPDFVDHPITYFLLPLLASHDRNRIAVTCYSSAPRRDAFTDRLRASADAWRDIARLDDQAAAELIHHDEIDLLFDLAGHTAGGRPMIFARRPAPVQVSYLGYPATMGMSTIQYRLTDPLADPIGSADPFYSERLARLPQTVACYAPPEPAPTVSDLPALRRGSAVTFGSFSSLAKIGPETIELWAAVLRAVPGSRFRLTGRGADGPRFGKRFRAAIAAAGVDSSRIDLRPAGPFDQYLAAHDEVDVLLDTFPFNGHTTLCHALWMGVPPVTLAGDRFASRLGASVLSNVGLSHLVATSVKQYAKIAADLAADLPRLVEMRRTMRDRMRASPLLDGGKFARGYEHAVEQILRSP
jgi:protein O-GlcNAc transferase